MAGKLGIIISFLLPSARSFHKKHGILRQNAEKFAKKPALNRKKNIGKDRKILNKYQDGALI